MISGRFLPCAWRFWVYAIVRGSCRMRVVAIRHKALLAWRSPPLLRRCLMVRSEEAWTGLTPHRAAKESSDSRR